MGHRAGGGEAARLLVLTYQGRFEEHVGELADTLTPRPLVLPLDVQQDAEIDAVFARFSRNTAGSTSSCTAPRSPTATTSPVRS